MAQLSKCLPSIILIILLSNPLKAQQLIQKHVQAMEIHGNIIIDGKLDEAAWATMPEASSFTQIKPHQGKPSHFRTIVKVGYNREAIYIGFICYEKEASSNIRVTSMERDFNWINNDFVAVVMDGFGDKRNAMVFGTNPSGAQFDELSFNDQQHDKSWNGLWKVRTHVNGNSWTAEFSIPWKTLRYKYSDKSQHWGINFVRLERNENELSAWNPYPRVYNFTRMQYAGLLTKVKVPKNKTNIQISPYISGNNLQKGKNSFPKINDTEIQFGGDLRWAINTNTSLDITANPDFAQAEADLQVNNVSRFSVYYPEKRRFFLENAALFGPGLNLMENDAGGEMKMQFFNSRTIGLDSTGSPIPIQAGLRLVHRSATNSYGAMTVKEKNDLTDDISYAGVFSYTHNFGRQNSLGLLNNFRLDRDNPSANNMVNGIDGFFQIGKSHSLNFMLLHSYTANRKNGMAGYLQYFYKTNPLRIWWTEAFLGQNFNNRLGFQSKSNTIATSIGIYPYFKNLGWLPLHKYIRSFEPGIAADIFHNTVTGKLSEAVLKIYPIYFGFDSGAYLGVVLIPTYENLQKPFTPLGTPIAPGEYQYLRYHVEYGSDASQKISYLLKWETGRYYHGKLRKYSAALSITPTPHVSVTATYSLDNLHQVGIKRQNKRISLFSLESRLALNPSVLFTGLTQWNSQDHSLSINARFSWEYKPLSYIYLVFNNRSSTNRLDLSNRYNQVLIKLSYFKQF